MKWSVIITAVVLGVVAAIIGTTRASGAAHANAGRTTIRFRAHQVINPRLLDIAKPAGPSTGDEATEKEILYSSDGRRIGYDLLHFTVISVNRKAQSLDVIVDGALVFRNGTVNIHGETTFQAIQVGATGGTRGYQRAMGQLRVLRTLPDGDDLDQLTYRIVG
jgi:hypothetical protein